MNSSIFLTPSTRAPTTSTPRRSAAKSTKKKTFVNPVCDTCQTCGKEYRCHRSFLKHQRGHIIVEQASKYPQLEKILEHLCDNFGNALYKLNSNEACFVKGQQYKEFIQQLIGCHINLGDLDEWNQFLNIIHSALTKGLQGSRFLLPSALTAILQKNAEHFLSDLPERQHLCSLFDVCVASADEEMVQFFIADYVFFLVYYIIVFVSQCVRSTVPAPLTLETGMQAVDNDYLESLYYIAGAKMHALNEKAKRFPKDKGWRNVQMVIKERLLESDTNPGPPAHVKGWTDAQNRGKLLYVSGLVFDFFCGVVGILEKQTSKRKVDYQDVIDQVSQSGVILLWDDAVNDYIPESESFNLMSGLVESFCQTFTVGKAQRMLNSIRKKGEASLPLRSQVAPRSSSDKTVTSKS